MTAGANDRRGRLGAQFQTVIHAVAHPGRWLVTWPAGSGAATTSLAAAAVLTAVSGVLSARLLGPTGKGAISLALVWAALAATIADVGVSQSLTFYASKEDEPSRIWGHSLTLVGIQTIVALP